MWNDGSDRKQSRWETKLHWCKPVNGKITERGSFHSRALLLNQLFKSGTVLGAHLCVLFSFQFRSKSKHYSGELVIQVMEEDCNRKPSSVSFRKQRIFSRGQVWISFCFCFQKKKNGKSWFSWFSLQTSTPKTENSNQIQADLDFRKPGILYLY